MKKRSYVTRFVASLLCIVMTVNSLSLESLASENLSATESTLTETLADTDEIIPVIEDTQEVPEAYIIAEINEERTETTKTFRMSDGSYAVAAYDQPVHYEAEEGVFEEIDNTFELEGASGEELPLSLNAAQTERTYTNRAGRNKIAFTENTTSPSLQTSSLETMEASGQQSGQSAAEDAEVSEPSGCDNTSGRKSRTRL